MGETREAAALVPAMAGAQRDLVESSLRVHGPAQPPRITNGSTQPPEAISQLVRAGILVPNRASIKGIASFFCFFGGGLLASGLVTRAW